MLKQLRSLIWFETTLAFRNRGGIWLSLFFFLLCILIIPFSLKPNTDMLKVIFTATIWVSFLPAVLLGGIRLFSDDFDDGFVDRYHLMNISYAIIFSIKVFVLFLSSALPLIIMMPLIGLLFSLDWPMIIKLCVGVLCSAPAITSYAALGALLSVHSKAGYLLAFIIIIPLIIPAIIFGAGIVYSENVLSNAIRLPLAFSLISVVLTVSTGSYLYRLLHHYR